jgi:hypothetical protein
MPTPGSKALSLCAGLLLFCAGGCTLWVGAELSSKPAEAGGDGGQGGDASASSTTSASNTASAGNSGSGGVMCPAGYGDCDGLPGNGCEAHLTKDAANCGYCRHACTGADHCKDGSCN